jgi:CRP/FNR family transcriptional regulator
MSRDDSCVVRSVGKAPLIASPKHQDPRKPEMLAPAPPVSKRLGNGQAAFAHAATPLRNVSEQASECDLHQLAPIAAQDATWALADFCLSAGLDPEARQLVARLLIRRIRLRKGDMLYRVGERFTALYAIRAGSCKTALLAQGGQEQVAGYHMAGEIIGLDGIGADIHDCQASALEDMEVCPVPFEQIEGLARGNDRLQRNLHRLLGQESARARKLMILLGAMRAEQRLAMFLLDLSERYRARGYSWCEFVLRLTREEIGSYLGLKLETVSRLFSRFQHEALIEVQGRTVKLLDRFALVQLVDCGEMYGTDPADMPAPHLWPSAAQRSGDILR